MPGVCWLSCVKVSRFHDFTELWAQGSRALHARHMLCQAFPKIVRCCTRRSDSCQGIGVQTTIEAWEGRGQGPIYIDLYLQYI